MINLTGYLERRPKLKLGTTENETGYIPLAARQTCESVFGDCSPSGVIYFLRKTLLRCFVRTSHLENVSTRLFGKRRHVSARTASSFPQFHRSLPPKETRPVVSYVATPRTQNVMPFIGNAKVRSSEPAFVTEKSCQKFSKPVPLVLTAVNGTEVRFNDENV